MEPRQQGIEATRVAGESQDPGLNVRDIPELPPLPKIAPRILAEINNDDLEIPQLASTIEMDPGLTARILGVANSAYFGCTDRIFSVADAIVRVLGLNMVRSLTLGMVLSEPFGAPRCTGFRLDHYWFTAMLSANLAHNLAGSAWASELGFPRNQVYISGLLHNFGVLVLVHAFPQEMEAVFAGYQEDPDALCTQDVGVPGLSYTRAGAVLAQRWHLPPEVTTVMRRHRDPEYRGEHWQMAMLVGFCARTACGLFEEDREPDLADPTLTMLGMDPGRVGRVLDKVRDKREDLRRMAAMLAQS